MVFQDGSDEVLHKRIGNGLSVLAYLINSTNVYRIFDQCKLFAVYCTS